MHLAAQYKKQWDEGKLPLPENPNAEKPVEWYRRWAEYLYGMHCANASYIGSGGISGRNTRSIYELRSYARGVQNTSKYREWIDCNMGGQNQPKEWLLNISMDPPKFFPKVRSVAVAKITEIKYDPVVKAVDTLSNEKRKKAILNDKLLVDPRMKQLQQSTGAQPKFHNPNAAGASASDIDMFADLGGYALPGEALMQDFLQTGLELAEYDNLQHMMSEDLFDLAIASARPYWDTFENRLAFKYIDPAGLVIPQSDYNDARDLPFFGCLEYETIGSLRRQVNVDEKEWYLAAKAYGNFGPNNGMRASMPQFGNIGFRRNFHAVNGSQIYDNFTLCVMTIRVVEQDEMVSDSGAEPICGQNVYKAKWIVGTNIVFDMGLDDTICRTGADGCKKAMLPLILWRTNEPSIVDRCIADIDDIAIATLKLRALIKNMPPGPRMIIDISGLRETIKLGDKTYTIQQLIGAYQAGGTLMIESAPEYADAGQVNHSARNPIQFPTSGIAEDFNLLLTEINAKMEAIRQASGINEVADGTANPNDMLNKVMEGMKASSNVSLSAHIDGIKNLYLQTVALAGRKYQAAALHGPVTLSHVPMSTYSVKMLTITPAEYFFNFTFTGRALPTEADIEMLTQLVVTRVQENKLSQADMFIVLRMLKEHRNPKMAMLYMARAVARQEAMIQEQTQQNMMLQSKSQAEANATMEQQKQATINLEGEWKLKNTALEGKNKLDAISLQLEGQAKLQTLGIGGEMLVSQTPEKNLG